MIIKLSMMLVDGMRNWCVKARSVAIFLVCIFNADEINEWLEENPNCPRGPGKTALCLLFN
ncbi:MAG: hypothetical protein NT128_07110 [Proteobacteria bacterium]|nr:hypothetical protein [Pseudomonadota bacterium]